MKKRRILLCMLAVLLLGACGREETVQAPVSQTEMQVQTQPEETVAVTQPPETEMTLPPTEPLPETEPVAEEITGGYQIFRNQKDVSRFMTDGNRYSRESFYGNQTLVLTSQEPFGALYVEWDILPGVFDLQWEGGSLECGQEGFYHDYIRLPEQVTQLTIGFRDGERKGVSELRLYTEGSAPEGVQDWLPPCEKADILVFPTHSDDDTLFFGTLIAHYAIETDYSVQTAFMVDHSYYQPVRKHERLDGLWEMGVRHYPILGSARDLGSTTLESAMAFYAKSDIPAWQVEQIRRFQPFVVVGHDLKGEYGNGGHKLNAHYLTQTVELAAEADQYPESAQLYGTWNTPKLYLHYYQENAWKMEVDIPLTRDPQGRTAFEIAEDAFAHHHSQQNAGFEVTVSEDPGYYDCRPFGLYRTLVGYDTAADVMENIVAEDWRK